MTPSTTRQLEPAGSDEMVTATSRSVAFGLRDVARRPLGPGAAADRVSHAQRMLVTSDAKVLEVAMEAGFGSLSRFNAAFRQLCGCSPRQYRSRHRL